jgi:hypothetical protein
MAESRIKDENYFQVSGFMVNRLGLKGVALNVYAIIYGFSQDGETEFTGSLQYLCDFCGGVSKPTIINALKELVKKDYILKREEIINGSLADLCISIHLNVYTSPSRRGAQTFFTKGYKESENLAKIIQSRINGMSMSPRLYNALWGDYYLLNESKITSVIVECGFLSSPEDEKLLLSEEYRNDISLAIFNGSLDFFCA